MSSSPKPMIVFLTGAWTNVDDNIRRGVAPGGVPSVSQIWTTCLARGFDVQVFILTRLEANQPSKTIELGGVVFHWIPLAFPRLTDWLASHGLLGLAKPLWAVWQLQMACRIVSVRAKPDIIYCMRTTFLPLGWLWARLCGAKTVLRQYGTWLYHAWFEQKKWFPRISLLGNLLAQRIPVDLQIMTNDGTQGDKSSRWAGFPMDRFRFWINGVDKTLRVTDFDKSRFKQKIGIGPDAPMLLTVGRLSHWKRLDRVVDAMPIIRRDFPDACLTIVGGGPLADELKDRVSRLGLSNAVKFAGPVPHERIRDYLNAADLMIMAHDLTNMCNTLIEALTAGCCVVTRDVGSTTEMVTHNQNAIVLQPGEAEDIARAVVDLLKNPQQRRRIATTAYENAMAEFQTWHERMEMEVNCLRELIGDTRTTS